MIAKLICMVRGHRKGVRMTHVTVTTTMPLNHFRCPRCKATWTRKAKIS